MPLRVSLRTLLIILALLAAILMPLMVHLHSLRNQTLAAEQLTASGARIFYQPDHGLFGLFPKIELVSIVEFRGEPVELQSLRELSVPHLAFVHAGVTSELVDILVEIPDLRMLNLSDTNVSDDALDRFEKLPDLEYLNVMGSGVTPKGVRDFIEHRPDCKLSVVSDTEFMKWLNRLFRSDANL